MASIPQGCIDAAKGALSHLTEDEIKGYVSKVFNLARQYDSMRGQGAIRRAMKEVNNQQLAEMMEDAKVIADNAAKLQARTAQIESKKATLLETISRRNKNLGDNIESAQQSATSQMYHSHFDKLSEEDINYLHDNNNDMEIADAHDGIKNDNPIAKKLGDNLKQYFTDRNSRSVISGAMSIFHLQGDRYFRGIHDPDAIVKGGRSTIKAAFSRGKYDISGSKKLWKDEIRKRINMEETFNDVLDLDGKVNEERADKILDSIYDNITTRKSEIFTKSIVANDEEAMARKSRRFFVWKSMRDQLEYNKKYGHGDLFSLINADIHAAGNKIGLSDMYGSNPHLTYLKLSDVSRRTYPDKGPSYYKKTGLTFNHALGTDKLALNPRSATFWANMRSLAGMSRMSLLYFQSIPDLAFQASFAERWGINYWHALGTHLKNQFNLIKSNPERNYIAKLMKINVDSHMGYMGRFVEANNMGDIMSKISLKFYKAIGIDAKDRGDKISSMDMIAHALGDSSNKSWDNLSPELQGQLGKFIEPHEWDGLRKKNTIIPGGKAKLGLFTTDNATNLTNDELKEIYGAGKQDVPLYQLRNDLYRKVNSIFSVACENVVLTPGMFMRAMMYQGTRPGDWHGEVLRSFMQFKGFIASYIDRVLYQGWQDAGSAKGRLTWAVHMLATTLPLSYLSTFMTNILQGQGMPSISQMTPGQAVGYLAQLIQPNVWMASSIVDSRNQNQNMAANLLFNPPVFKMFSNAAAAALAAAGLGSGSYGKSVAKTSYKAASSVLPFNGVPFISPLMRQMMGQESYLQPGQQQLYGK